MIGDVDRICSVLDGQQGVLRGENAFQNDRQASDRAQPIEIVPAESGLEFQTQPAARPT
jgi:hypothetical protein